MRGETDPVIEAGQPEGGADLGREPWVRCGDSRPNAFVEAAEDHQVGMGQPRFEETKDLDAGVAAIRRADGFGVEQLADQRDGLFGLHQLAGGAFRLLEPGSLPR